MNEFIQSSWSQLDKARYSACFVAAFLRKKVVAIIGCAALLFPLCVSTGDLHAQDPPPGVSQAYSEFPSGYNPQGNIQQVQLPGRSQYYEYLPPRRGWEDPIETPLDRFLKQSFSQMYGRVDYLHWSVSDPGDGFVGASGKKLGIGEGFSTPALIDGARLENAGTAPILNILLQTEPYGKVLIQSWEANHSELGDFDGDGSIYDVKDVVNIFGNAIPDGINDDDNDLDIFPRITNIEKSAFLAGARNNPNAGGFPFSTGTGVESPDPSDPPDNLTAQVAVLGVGQLAPMQAIQLDNTNGFRGTVGIPLSFGAFETEFFVMDSAQSSFQFIPILSRLIGSPGQGGVGASVDPLVIPVLVNGRQAPDVFDPNGSLVTDSNNYYLVYNESYRFNYKSEAWGASQSMFWTLKERPDRFKLAASLGFRFLDLREQMIQQGTFTDDPAAADFTYLNEGHTTGISTIDSVTKNYVYGPTAGVRAELGDEKFAIGLDAKLLLGLNTHEAKVSVDDLLFAGDDNFTIDHATSFAPGFELVVDTKIKLTEHASFVLGYNVMAFGGVTRPADNVHYDITAVRVANPPPNGGPDYTVNNNVILNKKKTSINLSGASAGLLINW